MNTQDKEHSGSFFTNVFKLVSGSIVAQALTVLTLPLVARLFSPEAIGVSSLFLTITGLLGVLACLRYELSIMLPESAEEAANLLGLSILSVVFVTLLTALFVFFFKEAVADLLNSPALKEYLYLAPLAVFVNGLFLALNYWNSRTKQFGRLSVARMSASVIHNSVRVGSGVSGYATGFMLIVSAILGQLVTTLVLGWQIFKDDGKLFRENIRMARILDGMKRHWKFPVFSSWSIFFNTMSVQMPAWILAYYFTPEIVGFYALGRMAISVPVRLLGTSISQVFFQKASESYHAKGNVAAVYSGVFESLVSLALLPFLLLVLMGDDLFGLAFGGKWTEAGTYARIIGPAIFFQFCTSPMMSLFIVKEKQNIHFILDLLLLIFRMGVLIFGGMRQDVYLALAMYSLVGVLYYIIVQIWISVNFGISGRMLLKPLLKYTGFSLPVIVLVILMKWKTPLGSFWITVSGCMLLLPYYAFVLKQYPAGEKIMGRLLRRIRMA